MPRTTSRGRSRAVEEQPSRSKPSSRRRGRSDNAENEQPSSKDDAMEKEEDSLSEAETSSEVDEKEEELSDNYIEEEEEDSEEEEFGTTRRSARVAKKPKKEETRHRVSTRTNKAKSSMQESSDEDDYGGGSDDDEVLEDGAEAKRQQRVSSRRSNNKAISMHESSDEEDTPPKEVTIANTSRTAVPWNDRYLELKAFKAKFGHVKPLRGDKTPESCEHLAQWITNKRSDFKLRKSSMPIERARLLHELGCRGFEAAGHPSRSNNKAKSTESSEDASVASKNAPEETAVAKRRQRVSSRRPNNTAKAVHHESSDDDAPPKEKKTRVAKRRQRSSSNHLKSNTLQDSQSSSFEDEDFGGEDDDDEEASVLRKRKQRSARSSNKAKSTLQESSQSSSYEEEDDDEASAKKPKEEETAVVKRRRHPARSNKANPNNTHDEDSPEENDEEEASGSPPKRKQRSARSNKANVANMLESSDEEDADLDDEASAASPKKKQKMDREDTGDKQSRRQKYAIGTTFRKAFFGHGVFEGTIIQYKPDTAFYKVEYEDGDQEDLDEEDLDELIVGDEMNPQQKYELGTTFHKEFPGHGVFEGTVIEYKPGSALYRVKYEDGDDEELKEEELDKLSPKASVSTPRKKKKKPKMAKSPARHKNNRLSIESLGQQVQSDDEYVDDEDDDASFLEEEGGPARGKKKKKKSSTSKKNEPPKDFVPFRINKVIASLTLPRSEWKIICQKINSSEIDNGSRWEQEHDDDDDDEFDTEEETRFLIKWSDLSFLHCSWEEEEDLLGWVQGAKTALSNFSKRCSDDGKLLTMDERNDGEYFDPEWVQPDRILEVHLPKGQDPKSIDAKTEDQIKEDDVGIVLDAKEAGFEEGLGRQFLIKWGNQPYSECSYEFERDLILADIDYKDKVQQYRNRCQQKSEKTRQRERQKGEAEFRRMYQSLFGDKSDAKEEKGASLFQKALEEHKYPNGGQLRDYQAVGVSWLIANYTNSRSCILADEMGLGKTIQVAAFLDVLASKLNRRGPFLVVVPLSTLGNWKKECEGWTDFNTIVYHGSAKDRAIIRQMEMAYESDRPKKVQHNELYLRKCSSARSRVAGNPWMAELVLTTPQLLSADDFSELAAVKWECIVVDEAQQLKNHNSKLATNLRDPKFQFKHKILLTGTPIQNSMEELFALLNFIDPVLFPDCDAFMNKYGAMDGTETLNELHKELGPYMLRRLKEDVEKSVPPKEEIIIEVELTIAQKQYYRALFEKNVKFLNKNKKKAVDGPSLLNLSMQLRKCCNHLFLLRGIEEEFTKKELAKEKVSSGELLVRGSGKLVFLDKLLPKLKDEGSRILIFSQFKIALNILEEYLNHREWKYERIDGNITGTRRQQAIDRFQAADVDEGKEKPFIMLLSTRAGGVGINLTAADTCIIFDSDWNPQNDLQAQARCHRIGQTKKVNIFRLLTRSTYEEKMFKLASRKLGLDQAVLSGFEAGKGPSKKEVERLLRHGAYDILNESKDGAEKASSAFLAQDIDTILERCSRVIVHENTGTGSAATGGKFSKAQFSTAASGDKSTHGNVDIDDPDFWKKMLGDPVEEASEEVLGKRARTVSNYSEADQEKKFMESFESEEEDDRFKGEKQDDEDDESFAGGEQSENESDDDEPVALKNQGRAPKTVPKPTSAAQKQISASTAAAAVPANQQPQQQAIQSRQQAIQRQLQAIQPQRQAPAQLQQSNLPPLSNQQQQALQNAHILHPQQFLYQQQMLQQQQRQQAAGQNVAQPNMAQVLAQLGGMAQMVQMAPQQQAQQHGGNQFQTINRSAQAQVDMVRMLQIAPQQGGNRSSQMQANVVRPLPMIAPQQQTHQNRGNPLGQIPTNAPSQVQADMAQMLQMIPQQQGGDRSAQN